MLIQFMDGPLMDMEMIMVGPLMEMIMDGPLMEMINKKNLQINDFSFCLILEICFFLISL